MGQDRGSNVGGFTLICPNLYANNEQKRGGPSDCVFNMHVCWGERGKKNFAVHRKIYYIEVELEESALDIRLKFLFLKLDLPI